MNVLIAGHDLKFIKFYIDYLEKSDHEVRVDQWENHVVHNIKKSFSLLEWADVIFCEWGLGNTIFYSKNKRSNQRLIVRLHRQELETSYLSQAKISKIDCFIAVSPYIYEEFTRIFHLPREKMHLVYNNVDLSKLYNKNKTDRKYHIGMVGYLPKLKRMDLALDIFEKVYNQDSRYILHFKGKKPDELRWLMRIEEEREYYESQFKRIEESPWKENVIFEPFGDVVDFYNRMEFILSTSDVESFHLAVAEGMACGSVPIITNWEGSSTIYPSEFIINNLESVNDYINNVRSKSNEIKSTMLKQVNYFDQTKIIDDLNKILEI